MVLQAELCKGQDSEESPLIKQKKHVFEQVVATVHRACRRTNTQQIQLVVWN